MKTPLAIRRGAGAAHPVHHPLATTAQPQPSAVPAGFFANQFFAQRLAGEAMRWIGTPFVPHAQVLGAGVDCVHLVAALYEAGGFMDGFHPPRYTIDAGAHQTDSQFLEWLATHREFAKVYERTTDGRHDASIHDLALGDLLLFKIGASEHHCGVLLGGKKFIHSRAGANAVVAIDSLTDPIYKRCLTFAFRPALQHSSAPSLTVGLAPEPATHVSPPPVS